MEIMVGTVDWFQEYFYDPIEYLVREVEAAQRREQFFFDYLVVSFKFRGMLERFS
jgi:hypothetical protein